MNGRNGWLYKPPIQPDEGIAAAALLGWGVLLLLPVEVFATTPTFSTMRRAMSEEAWGVTAIAIFYLFVVGVAMGRKWAHLTALGLMASWWLGVAGMLYDGGGLTGPWMYGLVGVSCLIRLAARAGR